MKKSLFYILQLISVFLFVVLLSGVYRILKKVFNSKEDVAFNFGYGFAGILVLGLLFWLNIKLFKYASRKTDK
jgi:hypothetical protein